MMPPLADGTVEAAYVDHLLACLGVIGAAVAREPQAAALAAELRGAWERVSRSRRALPGLLAADPASLPALTADWVRDLEYGQTLLDLAMTALADEYQVVVVLPDLPEPLTAALSAMRDEWTATHDAP